MKTNLDKIDYESIYDYSLEEYESVMDFLQLTAEFQTAEFWRDASKSTTTELTDAINPNVVMKIFFKKHNVKWQYEIEDKDYIFSEVNFMPCVRDQRRLSASRFHAAVHDKKFVIGLFLQLLKNGICLKCRDISVDIPSFKTLSELKMKIAIKNGTIETPFKACL